MWQRKAARFGAGFVQHIVPAVIKPARALWNEVIGFIFLCFGTIFGFRAARYAISGEHGKLVLTALCAVLMAWYGVTSFLRARKISRS